MFGASYQRELLDAIRRFLPSGFFRTGTCEAEHDGPRND
jgi:hypothetical protein